MKALQGSVTKDIIGESVKFNKGEIVFAKQNPFLDLYDISRDSDFKNPRETVSILKTVINLIPPSDKNQSFNMGAQGAYYADFYHKTLQIPQGVKRVILVFE